MLIGIITFLLLHSYLPGNEYLILLFILIGSILPDIDEHKSKAVQLSGILGKIVSFFASHRGIFHSFLLPLVLFGILGYFWNFAYALALFVGYIVHLIADALTPMGIPAFWPFSEFKLRGPIRCGTWQEWILFGMLTILIIKEVLF